MRSIFLAVPSCSFHKTSCIKRMIMDKRRVVVTGLGVIAPNGIGKEEFWFSNVKGRSGINKITRFDVSNLDSKIAGEVINFDPAAYMPLETVKRTDRFVHLGLASAKMALEDSHLDVVKEDKGNIGVIIGSGLGGILFHEEQMRVAYERGVGRLHPLCVPRITPNAVSSHIAIQFGFLGPNMVISTACASGTNAVGEAFRKIQYGEIEACLTGGVEAPLTQFTFGAYCAMRVLSKRNDSPQEASRPFDKERDGFVLGEGAAVLILEELSHALKRNAHIYAEIIGYAAGSGAHHMVIPKPRGEDAAIVMRLALNDANLTPKDIDYINAHGTSTQANDKAETQAIKKVFGEHAYKVAISATKSMIGHTIGAAGAIEALVCCLAIDNDTIPPTANYAHLDPECDLDYVPNQARKERVGAVLSNSFGFGSCNTCLILTKMEG
jgi:3-oxoacyl-[acyl-carrier-protein] synthase II